MRKSKINFFIFYFLFFIFYSFFFIFFFFLFNFIIKSNKKKKSSKNLFFQIHQSKQNISRPRKLSKNQVNRKQMPDHKKRAGKYI